MSLGAELSSTARSSPSPSWPHSCSDLAVVPTSALLLGKAAPGVFGSWISVLIFLTPVSTAQLPEANREWWDFRSLHFGPLELLGLDLPSTPASSYHFL